MPFSGEKPEFGAVMLLHEFINRVVNAYFHFIPIIKACMAYAFLRDIKTKRTHKRKVRSRDSACSGNIASVLRNLRIEEANIEHKKRIASKTHFIKGVPTVSLLGSLP